MTLPGRHPEFDGLRRGGPGLCSGGHPNAGHPDAPIMSIPADFRQRVPDLRARLDHILATDPAGGVPAARRDIDTTGNRSRAQGFKTAEARLMAYAERRYSSIARVCVLLALVRDTPGLALGAPEVGFTRAYWQAFGGNSEFNACHTCPALLTFDGQLPSVLTTNRGLQRHLIVEFADCMLMPLSVNGIDKVTDEQFGRNAFVAAAHHLLHTPGANWQTGLDVFDAQMADVYENARLILFTPTPLRSIRPPEQEAALDTLCAYFEGMQASRANRHASENFRKEVQAEAKMAS